MFSSFRDRFGTAGLVVAIMALVIALVGTAYAASKLNSTQKKEVEKIAKKFAGKPGAPGAPGAKGDTGAAGSNGSNGTNGKDGTSAQATSFTGSKTVGSVKCTEGGVVVKSASPETAICNGKEGEPGVIHPGETLPSSATETGSWTATVVETELGPSALIPISFPIPLAAPISSGGGHYVAKEKAACEALSEPEKAQCLAALAENCPGTAAEPAAKAGNLCLYEAVNVGATFQNFLDPGAGFASGIARTGTVAAFGGELKKFAYGTWAVTAS